MNYLEKHWKKAMVLLMLCCLFLGIALLLLLYRDGYFKSLYHTMNAASYSYQDNAQYIQRESMFEMCPVQKADIVFVGDSITARGEWQEFFPDQVVLNRGIDSDVTEGVRNRLSVIIEAQPKKIFLMIGINDLRQGISSETTLNYYGQILDDLTAALPDCEVYVQSILPVHSSTGIPNKDVQTLNASIQELAIKHDVTYVDIYSLLADEDNDLPKAYSIDGVHMTGEGYGIWVKALKPYVQERGF